MALARWQRTITTGGGIIVPSATVEVRRESDNGLPALFSDRAGAASILNPFNADSEGFAAFHVIGGVYKITVTSGSFTRTLRYVGIGTAQEFDVEQLSLAFANFPDMLQATVLGRPDGAGTGDPQALTAAQLQTIYNSVGGSWGGPGRAVFMSSTPTNLLVANSGFTILNFNASRTANLPTPANGLIYAFAHIGTGTFTIDTPGSETINFPDGTNAASFTLDTTTGAAAIVVCDGTNWFVFATDINRILATTTVEGVVEIATAAEYRANTPARALNNTEVWASADYFGLTDAATIAVDMASGYNFSVTLAGNRTLGNPTNTKNGQTGAIIVRQDGSGSRTLAYGTNWEFTAGAAPILSTAINAKDWLFYQVESSTSILITGINKAVA